MTKIAKHDFKAGDSGNWSAGTDVRTGVVSQATPSSVTVIEYEGTLLNGPDSGEPDALTFVSGGFVGHMSGEQRYSFSPTSHTEKFTHRSVTYRDGNVVTSMKLSGTSSKGSMRSWGILRHGMFKHYDFNF